MTPIREIFAISSHDAGWDLDSEITVLLDFIEQEQATADSLVAERFERYLDERLNDEDEHSGQERPR